MPMKTGRLLRSSRWGSVLEKGSPAIRQLFPQRPKGYPMRLDLCTREDVRTILFRLLIDVLINYSDHSLLAMLP
jgi:hypothetical protein